MRTVWKAAIAASIAAFAACRSAPPVVVSRDDGFELMHVEHPKPTASASASAPPPPPAEASPYDRWRIALEDYQPRAAAGTVPLDAARNEQFRKYIAKLHEKVHPRFAGALVEIDEASGDAREAINARALAVAVEIAIEGATGRVRKIGVVKRSGDVDFDTLALDAVKKSEPFEKPAAELLSPDGNAYVRWTFRRDPNEGCAPRDAQGFVLKKAPWPP
ncbi:MAG TPA: TonB C-terminal domain-containing protein [Minicystis sp.]|nr:TonB C-terminal domain-containing protein [Minicystis sp.]